MKTNLMKYTLPAYWAGYLINADASYLSQDDIDRIDRETKNMGICIDADEEEHFRLFQGIHHLVKEYTFVQP